MFRLLAQLVEQVTLNHWVVGSSPTQPTKAALNLNWDRVVFYFFFVKPFGQAGFNPTTFLVVLPLTQVIAFSCFSALCK
ncbi:MAG: hypothetical protein RL129_892 [Actinomycetota bacterium]